MSDRTWDRAGAAPLYATPRTPGRFTEGPQTEVVARALGTPFIPWQSHVAEVAGERLPGGEYAYKIVVVSVPRQSGKTTLLRAVGATRCLVCGRDVFYTAQTGKDARERWTDLANAVRSAGAFKGRAIVRLSAGSERVVFPGGAAFRVFAPTAESLHGYTPPTVMLDEAFAHSGPEGEVLMGAIGPAQMTVVDRQLWIVSTAGTAESEFLNTWLERGMAGEPGIACFVWAAGEDIDMANLTPAQVEGYHPAVGFTINGKTLEAADIIDARASAGSLAEFTRAYGNRRTATTTSLIPLESWRPLAAREAEPPASTRDMVLTYDVAHDGASAAVMGTWDRGGFPHTEVILYGPGTTWVAGAVAEMRTAWRPRAVAATADGPATPVTEELARLNVPVRTLNGREFASATAQLLAAIREDEVSHDGAQVLEDAAVGLVTRPSADGVVLSRRHSHGDVSPAVGMAVGIHVLANVGAQDTTPVIRFGAA